MGRNPSEEREDYMKGFKVSLQRNIKGIVSSITLDVSADSRDEAASIAESLLTGWHTQNVVAA